MHLLEGNSLLQFDTAAQIKQRAPTGIGGSIIIPVACTIVDNKSSCADDQFYLCDGVEPIKVGVSVPAECTAVTFAAMSPDGTSVGDACAPAELAASVTASITASATITSAVAPNTSACVSTPLESFYLQALYPGSGIDNYLSLETSDGSPMDDIVVPSLGLPAKFSIVGTTLTTLSGTSGLQEVAETHVQENRLYFDTPARNAQMISEGSDSEVFECSIVNGNLSCDGDSAFFICPGLLGVRLGASVPGFCTGVDLLYVVPTGDSPGDSCAVVSVPVPSVTSAITSVTSACVPA